MIYSAAHIEKRSSILLEKACRPLRSLDTIGIRSFSHPEGCCRRRSVDTSLTVAETIGLLDTGKGAGGIVDYPRYSCRLYDTAKLAGSGLGRAEVDPPRWSIIVASALFSTNIIQASKR